MSSDLFKVTGDEKRKARSAVGRWRCIDLGARAHSLPYFQAVDSNIGRGLKAEPYLVVFDPEHCDLDHSFDASPRRLVLRHQP